MKRKWMAAALLGTLILTGCGKETAEVTEQTVPILTEAPTMVTEATEAPETVPETTAASTEPETTASTEPEETEPPRTYGRVIKVESLNVREGPSVNTRVVKKLHKNEEVEILEGIVLDSVQWAHIADGWACLDYLEVNGPVPAPKGNEPGGMPGVIYHTDTLNVRKSPSGSAEKVGELRRNDVVVIYEIENGWGRMDLGWVSMEYVQLQKDNAVLSVTSGDWVPEHTPESDLHDFTAPSEGIYMDDPLDGIFD